MANLPFWADLTTYYLRARPSIRLFVEKVLVLGFGVVLVLGTIIGARIFLDYLARLHWLVGLIVASLILVLLFWALRWIGKQKLTSLAFGRRPEAG